MGVFVGSSLSIAFKSDLGHPICSNSLFYHLLGRATGRGLQRGRRLDLFTRQWVVVYVLVGALGTSSTALPSLPDQEKNSYYKLLNHSLPSTNYLSSGQSTTYLPISASESNAYSCLPLISSPNSYQ